MKTLLNKTYLALLIVLSLTPMLQAQEALAPMYSSTNQHSVGTATLHLKQAESQRFLFFDDFSDIRIYKKYHLWESGSISVNNYYGFNPVSIGVATFDALDNDGKLYAAATSLTQFKADSLCSSPIDLRQAGKTAYLSFFYQPGGYGEKPDYGDSLVLEFYNSKLKHWEYVWAAKNNIVSDTLLPFKFMSFEISDTNTFLTRQFKFRFTNYCSLNSRIPSPGRTGNGDIWNIDYVKLDTEQPNDTILNDLAIVAPTNSIIKKYEAMPWTHFYKLSRTSENPLNTKLFLKVKKHYQENETSIAFSYEMEDLVNPDNFSEPSGNSIALDKELGFTYIFDSDLPNYLSIDEIDSAIFKVKTYIETSDKDIKENDTTISYQYFTNYFAYDDGTAEYGYGLFGSNSFNGRIAYKYVMADDDSLQAIRTVFNESIDKEPRIFRVTVWADSSGLPGKILYIQNDTVKMPGTHTFLLDKPILAPKTFFIGIIQLKEYFLNIGWDVNKTYDKSNVYVFTYDKGWTRSNIKGSLMMRPIVGKHKDALTITPISHAAHIAVYPNPATDFIHIQTNDADIAQIQVFDLMGKAQLLRINNFTNINVSNLKSGIYILRVLSKSGQIYNTKFIKT